MTLWMWEVTGALAAHSYHILVAPTQRQMWTLTASPPFRCSGSCTPPAYSHQLDTGMRMRGGSRRSGMRYNTGTGAALPLQRHFTLPLFTGHIHGQP